MHPNKYCTASHRYCKPNLLASRQTQLFQRRSCLVATLQNKAVAAHSSGHPLGPLARQSFLFQLFLQDVHSAPSRLRSASTNSCSHAVAEAPVDHSCGTTDAPKQTRRTRSACCCQKTMKQAIHNSMVHLPVLMVDQVQRTAVFSRAAVLWRIGSQRQLHQRHDDQA